MTRSGSRDETSDLVEAQHEPGSRGRVLRNLRGITSVREMAWAEHQEQMRSLGDLVGTFHRDHRFTAQDTDNNLESFFVYHAYFLGANDPYSSLKTTLKAEINPEPATLNSDTTPLSINRNPAVSP